MLFEDNPSVLINTPTSKLILYRNFLSKIETSTLFTLLLTLDFESEEYIYYGKLLRSLKKSTALGEKTFTYSYSGINRTAQNWEKFPEIIKLANKISKYIISDTNFSIDKKSSAPHECSGGLFNFVLCNLYAHGKAAVGWHSDDESIINQHVPIASISFGESRTFEICKNYKNIKSTEVLAQNVVNENFISVKLDDGDLIIMHGNFQNEFLHRIKKDSSKNIRINLTFRNLKRSDREK